MTHELIGAKMVNDDNDWKAEPLGKFFIQQKEVNEFVLEKDIK